MGSLPISGTTRVAFVIGDPIAHSLSPAMHNAAFRHLGIDGVYVALRIDPANLAHAVAGFRALDILGFNVTVPHKEKILPLLDRVSPAARLTGAVNTVIRRKGKLLGENTDVIGFRRALEDEGVELEGKRALLIGAGGAARAVLTALKQGRASSVVIANRTPQRSETLARRFRARGFRCSTISLDQLQDERLAASIELTINSTSIGLTGESFLPIPYRAFSADCLFYDLIPRGRTDFLFCARRARRKAVDGLGMLLHQGAAAFELWTGEPAPVAVMRQALDDAFQRALRNARH